MAATVQWNSNKLAQEIVTGMAKRMALLGEHMKGAHMRKLSKPVVKITKARRRTTTRGGKGSTYTYAVPSSRSKPGEYPRAETGLLMKSIQADTDVTPAGITLKVGTTSKYGAELELKAGRLGLRATMIENIPVIKKVLTIRGMESPAFIFK